MRSVWIVKASVAFALLLAVVACEGTQRQEPPPPTASNVARPTNTTALSTPTAKATAEQPTAVPTATPVPTPRPLKEGECIGWYESPSFLDRAVCVEGKVNFVRSANPARTRFFVVVDPSVPDIDHCCGLFYGWLYVEDLFDPIPAGGMSALLEGKCVRLHGTIEKTRGRYRISVNTPQQLEIIECDECQIPDACGF